MRLEHHRERLAEDHEHASRLGEACRSCEPLTIRGDRIDTNIVICEVDPNWGTANQMVKLLEEKGVLCLAIGRACHPIRHPLGRHARAN